MDHEEPYAPDENTREECMDISLDRQDDVYLIVELNVTMGLVPEIGSDSLGTFTNRNNSIIVIGASYDSSSKYCWGFIIVGDDRDQGHAVDVCKYGPIINAGFFRQIIYFDPDQIGVDNITSRGGWDVFFAKYRYDGEFLWAKSYRDSAINKVHHRGIVLVGAIMFILTATSVLPPTLTLAMV